MIDEATMLDRFLFEALDRTLRDLMAVDRPFGGKRLILAGDFSLLWKVLPSASRLAAMPVVAIAKAVDPPSIHLTPLRIVLRRYVLPHPPLASMKTRSS